MGVIKAVRRLIARLIYYLVDIEYLLLLREKRRQIDLQKTMVLGNGSRLSKSSLIHNYRQDPRAISVGEGTIVEGEALVFPYGGQITIGSNSYVGVGTRVWSGEKVTIGSNVLISHHVSISDTSAHERDHILRAERFKELVKKGLPKEKSDIQTSPIVIEDYAWINNDCVILRGVTIGKGAIIAAGSVVTKDVPPFTFVGGNTASVLRKLNDE